jgi:hypothetical protein
MPRKKSGEGTGGERGGQSRPARRTAAESSKDGLPDDGAKVVTLHPASAANLIKGHEANRARGAEPYDPDYVTRYQRFCDGELTVSELDDEEVLKGRFRDRNGLFAGRPPNLTARQRRLLDAERMKRQQMKFMDMLSLANKAIEDIFKSPMAKDADKLRAAELILNRTMGTSPQKVEVSLDDKPTFNEVLDGVVEIARDTA